VPGVSGPSALMSGGSRDQSNDDNKATRHWYENFRLVNGAHSSSKKSYALIRFHVVYDISRNNS